MAQMTREHFEAFAAQIRQHVDYVKQLRVDPDIDNRNLIQQTDNVRTFARIVSSVGRRFNPRFDGDKFWKACGLDQF